MEIPFNKLQSELIQNVSFWLETVFDKDQLILFPEVSIFGTPNTSVNTGSMYISRILFGASSAFKLIKNEDYLKLATQSFIKLQEFQHPKGGYYWAKTSTSTILHDADNTCMAQAFALYGLVAYAKINPSKEVDIAIENQYNFIQNTLTDTENGGFIDGFKEDWTLGKNPTKALGTHIHLLEAFVSLYEYNNDKNLVPKIEA
nr:AGE family epimerase/isomerase [Lutibacter sp.]